MDAIEVKAELLIDEAKSTGDSQDLAFASIVRAAIMARSRKRCTNLLKDIAPYLRPMTISLTDPSIVAEALLDPLGKKEPPEDAD